MGFTFCIAPTHDTIQPRRDRVHFPHDLFVISLAAVVLSIIDYLWYLVAHDAPFSTVPLFVGATVTVACILSTFQASLHGYSLGPFITVYFAHIRISDFLLVALMAVVFISGALLALGAAILVVNSSFFALSASVLVLSASVLVLSFGAYSHGWVFGSVTVVILFILDCLWYLVAHGASLSTVSSLVDATVTAVACLSSVSFQASLRGDLSLFILRLIDDVESFQSTSVCRYIIRIGVIIGCDEWLICGIMWLLFGVNCIICRIINWITHIRTSRIRTSTNEQDIADPRIAPEQRNYITVITEKGACIALRCVVVSLCFCI